MRWVACVALVVACSLPEEGTLLVGEDAGNPDVVAPTDGGPVDATDEAPAIDDAPAPTPDVAVDAPIVTAGDALQFTGGSYVDMGPIPIPADFTLEAWIHPASASGETYVVAEDERNQGDGQFRFGLSTAGKLFFMMTDASGSSHGLYSGGYSLQSPAAIPIGVWTHVAAIKNGAAFALTVDGASVATFTADASFVHGGPAVNFRVAARVDTNGTGANGAFDGIIDEVRLWSQPRSAAEIAQTMSTTVPPSSAGLFAYWRFDDGAGTTAADEEGGHPGTLVANPAWVKSTAF